MIITLFCKTITTCNSGYSTRTGALGCQLFVDAPDQVYQHIHSLLEYTPKHSKYFLIPFQIIFIELQKAKKKNWLVQKYSLEGVQTKLYVFFNHVPNFFLDSLQKISWGSILIFFFFFLYHHLNFFLFIAMVILSASVKTFSVYRILDFQYVPGK